MTQTSAHRPSPMRVTIGAHVLTFYSEAQLLAWLASRAEGR